MGQIRGKNAHIDACNLRSLSSFGIPAAGQHILVSTDNSATADGQGNFDCYVVGDGTTAATALPLKTIAESALAINGKNSVNGKAVSNYIDDTLFDTTLSENLVNVNDEDVYDRHSMNVNGVISSLASAVISGYIPIKPNTTYSLWYLYAGATLKSTKPICATVFNADKQVIPTAGISKFTTNAFTITDTSAAYVRLTCYRAYFIDNPPMLVEGEDAPASYVAYSETKLLKKDLFPEFDEYAEADKVVTKDYLLEQVMSSNLLNTNDPDYIAGILNYTSGEVSPSTGYHTSGYIPIKTNTYYIVGCDEQLQDNAEVRVLVGYDENKQRVYAEGNTNNAPNPFIISKDRVKYIRISLANAYANATPYMNEGSVVKGYEEFEGETKIKDSLINHDAFIEKDKQRFLNYNGDIADGQTIVLGENYDVKLNKHAVFRGRLGTFGKLIIGHGMESESSKPTRSAIGVDNTNLYFYYWPNGNEPIITVPHGLVIKNTISICLDIDELMHAKVEIISDGTSFVYTTNRQWYGDSGSIYATSIGTILSLVEFSWTCDGYDKLIQIYGDSYLGTGYDGRWAYYLVQNGFANKCLLDGWGGRTTKQGYVSFMHNISLSTPKYAVWLLGGNDPDPTSSEKPNERWLHYTRLFLNECDKRGIIPILQLVQEMPTKKNTYKNEWVRNSGRRYIDFVTPVGSDLYEYWYEGMLSSDNVHPSSKGAIELYTQFISQFPEIMIQD